MKRSLPVLLALAAALSLPTPAFAENGGAAVLDIDKVAQALGIDQSVLAELQVIESNLNTQLAQVRGNLQQQMNELEGRAGPQRTPEIQAQLLDANRKLNADFNAVVAQAQGQLEGARVQRINAFRDQLRPIALEAAKAKGLQVVLTLTPQIYAHDETIDITEEVIEGAKAAGIKGEVSVQLPATGEISVPAPVAPAPAAPAVPATPSQPQDANQ